MKKRILVFLLAALMVVTSLPVSVGAESEATRVRKEVKSVYRRTLYRTGMSSMNGWCGLQTSWALYLMGINTQLETHDGRDQYDSYKNRTVTTGGYRIKAYSANDYDLAEALNLLSRNGTRNVYNILLGFQKTITPGGRRYGHATFLHAILDGKVYFTEGFSVGLQDRYFPGGTVMVCTIEEFCWAYNSWTTYEGLIHFYCKEYSESCEAYSTNVHVRCSENLPLLSDPGVIDGQEPECYGQAVEGERLYATGLYRNKKDGGLYYLVDTADGVCYIDAGKTEMLVTDFSDVTLKNVEAPANHVMNTTFTVHGDLSCLNNNVDTLLIQILDESGTPVQQAQAAVGTKNFKIGQKKVREQMLTHTLPAGKYTVRVCATLRGYYVENGALVENVKTIELWNSEFQVGLCKNVEGTPVVRFDARGGTTSLNRTVGKTLESLPEAVREGYTFIGWFTAPDGGTQAEPGMALTEDLTLYARWTKDSDETVGWVWQNKAWYYLENGTPRTGWLRDGHATYYILEDGRAAEGWVEVNGQRRLFSGNGLLVTGWTETEEGTKYLLSNGTLAQGWIQMEGRMCYFDNDGAPLTGWQKIDGNYYCLDEQGSPHIGYHAVGQWNCYFDDNGILMAAVSCCRENRRCYVHPSASQVQPLLSELIQGCHESCENSGGVLAMQIF